MSSRSGQGARIKGANVNYSTVDYRDPPVRLIETTINRREKRSLIREGHTGGKRPRRVYAEDGRTFMGVRKAGEALGVSYVSIVNAIKRSYYTGYPRGVRVSYQPFVGVRYSNMEGERGK